MKREEKKIFWTYVFAFGMAETVITCMWYYVNIFLSVNSPYDISWILGDVCQVLSFIVFPAVLLIASFVYLLMQMRRWFVLKLYHAGILLFVGTGIAAGILYAMMKMTLFYAWLR